MGIFGQSPFDADIEKATSESHTNENWSLILDVCDKVSSNPRNAKDCLKAIMKRMGHADPHIVMQAITLLNACVSNCGKSFHLEIASREFENEFRRLLSKAQPKVSLKMRQMLKTWVENDFKNDAELNLIPSLYAKLRQEGVDFTNLHEKPPKSAAAKVAAAAASKDPNVVSSQQEEDDIAKAIELSLKETKSSPKQQSTNAAATSASASAYPSLYPSFGGSGSVGSITSTGAASNNSTNSQPEPRKVRALYDFEAAEENELTFVAGEILHVLDDSDPNWWKGFNQRGDGLFPSNFVTADLSVDPERLDINQQNKTKKTVQFEDDTRELQQKTEAAAAAAANQRIEIDESKVDRLLHLLHEANPEDPSQDSEEMLRLEQEVNQMGPLIDAELERVDRKHAQLTQLSSDLVDAINLYHSLMRDDRAAMMSASSINSFMPGALPPGLSGGFQTAANTQMLYGAAGYSSGNFSTQMPQGYGMPSLQSYGGSANPTSLPVTTATSQPGGVPPPPTSSHHNAALTGMAGANFGQNATQMQIGGNTIPMQFQNGHIGPQLNGGMNSLPPHLSNNMLHGQQQQGLYGSGEQTGTAQPPSQQNYQMLPPPQQQQQQQQQYTLQQHQQLQQQQQQPQTPTITTNANDLAATRMPPNAAILGHNPQMQQQATAFMGAPTATMPAFMQQPQQQQQQQQQQQYVPMPNGQQAFMTPPAGPTMMMPPGLVNNHNNNGIGQHNAEHISQLQQQMAAMSLQAGMNNQPVTQNFLVQNEPKNNIPIYQQQR